MVLSCSTSEYILRSWKGESSMPWSTALAMVPMPACSGCSAGDRRPALHLVGQESFRWPAMARCLGVGRQHVGQAVGLLGDDDGDDLLRSPE